MTDREPYPTAAGVESAIRHAAKKAAASDPALDVNKRIQLEYFNRFLSRVFSEGDGSALRIAIVSEARRRQMDPFDDFTVPSTWGAGYAKLAKPIPYCADYRTVDLARNLVTRLIDTTLSGDADGKTWAHGTQAWQ